MSSSGRRRYHSASSIGPSRSARNSSETAERSSVAVSSSSLRPAIGRERALLAIGLRHVQSNGGVHDLGDRLVGYPARFAALYQVAGRGEQLWRSFIDPGVFVVPPG